MNEVPYIYLLCNAGLLYNTNTVTQENGMQFGDGICNGVGDFDSGSDNNYTSGADCSLGVEEDGYTEGMGYGCWKFYA